MIKILHDSSNPKLYLVFSAVILLLCSSKEEYIVFGSTNKSLLKIRAITFPFQNLVSLIWKFFPGTTYWIRFSVFYSEQHWYNDTEPSYYVTI